MSKQRREKIKKKQQTKKIVTVIAVVLVVLIAASTVAVMSLHKCDDCQAFIFGKGYYKEEDSQGVLTSVFGSIFGDTENIPLETVDGVIICEECAKNNPSVKAELRPVSEFRR